MYKRFLISINASFVFSLLVLTGCGGSGRQPVSGTVSYDGQPLPYGTISFDPDSSKGVNGPQGNAEIQKGIYKTSSDNSPIAGAHIVRITGWKNSPAEGMLGAPVANYTTTIEVPVGGGKLDFDIPAAKAK